VCEPGIIEPLTEIAKLEATGHVVMAIMLVQTDTEKHDEARQALSELPEISEVYSVLGEYDLFGKARAKSIEDLLEIVVIERVKREAPLVQEE
jgi:Lrp/AsnC family transcriptional regulator, regulator for asnA, asnC and gidA